MYPRDTEDMTKQSYSHLTASGHLSTTTSVRDYRFVTVGEKSDGTIVVVGWHGAPPKSPPTSYLANLRTEAINGGER